MEDVYAVVEGRFGAVEIHEIKHDLITHAHSNLQFGFWMGGGHAHTDLGLSQAVYNDQGVVGVNRYQSHNFKIHDTQAPPIVLFLYVYPAWLDDVHQDLSRPVVLTQPQISITPEIRLAAWQLMQRTLTYQVSEIETLEADVFNLLRLTLGQAALQMLPLEWPVRRRLIDYRLRLALKDMQAQGFTEMSIEGVCKKVGLSRSRLYELFQSELNSSPQVIWNSLRMKSALRCVGAGDEDLATIASTLGFSTAGNFSRYFRSVMGISPLAYRRASELNQQASTQIFSISYTSITSYALTQQALEKILASARLRNAKLKVTGILLFGEGRFIQFLEGTQRDLMEVLEHITTASQHQRVRWGEFVPINQRSYADFSMTVLNSKQVNTFLVMSLAEIHVYLSKGQVADMRDA